MNRRLLLGFTIFELLIVISLVAIIGVMIVPSYRGYAFRSELVIARDVVTQVLNQAQNNARSGKGDSSWGVHFGTGQIVLFKGSAFTAFAPATDNLFWIPSSVTITGPADVIFFKLTGLPNWSGTINLSGVVSQTVLLQINAQGVVNY